MSALADYGVRREREKQWHHAIQRYITVGRKQDDLRCVWDLPSGHRVSRWLRPDKAERVAADCEKAWKHGSVTSWVYKVGDAPPPR